MKHLENDFFTFEDAVHAYMEDIVEDRRWWKLGILREVKDNVVLLVKEIEEFLNEQE